MGTGFENALGELTLVLFTTLAPSGVIAMVAMSAALLSRAIGEPLRGQLNRWLGLPVAVALVGLVASATHLGNPANALYVLTGVGRSPLSNEVVAAVVYFGLAGTYWFASFATRRVEWLERVWLVAADLAGCAFVLAIAFAYDAETIVTWDTPLVPVNLCLNALVGGPLLAMVSLLAAERGAGSAGRFSRMRRVLACVSAVALALNAVGYALQGAMLSGMGNSVTTASAQAPGFFAGTVLFCALGAVGIALDLRLAVDGARPRAICWSIAGCALALGGVFAMRFLFYMSYLTVGLGV